MTTKPARTTKKHNKQSPTRNDGFHIFRTHLTIGECKVQNGCLYFGVAKQLTRVIQKIHDSFRRTPRT